MKKGEIFMVQELRLPKLGQTMESGVVSRWLVSEGETVNKGEPICEIETDKTNIEYESPFGGTLLKAVAQEGEEKEVQDLIAYIGDPGEEIPKPQDEPIAAQEESPTEQEESSRAEEDEAEPSRKTLPRPRREGERIFISPRARRKAREENIDYTEGIEPTGPNGRIVERDIIAAIEQDTVRYHGEEPEEHEAAAEPCKEVEKKERQDAAKTVSVQRREPMSRMRRIIAERLQKSAHDAPHIYLTAEIDMEKAVELREEINLSLEDAEREVKVSFNDLILRAAALALREHPQLNCRLEEDEIVYLDEINLGMAVGVEDGLLVPVIRSVDRKTISEIAQKSRELARRAREEELTPDEYSGGTFTVSNLGMYGIEQFTAIINPPESAILAVGEIAEKVVAFEGESQVRARMKVTLSCDHRVVDGLLGARFLKTFRNLLEEPFGLLI